MLEKKERIYMLIIVFALILISFLTNFYGNNDIYDYSDAAKFFAGKFFAKTRTSHSYLYGFIHAPFVYLMENYFAFKITSLISLFLIAYSVYIISRKNKSALWLILLSPIVWYMAPWISPIQLSSLLFLWGYYFIKKYNEENKLKDLFYSAILIGLGWAFWDAILFFIPLFLISFFYDKKLLHVIYFIVFLFVGVLPRLILDQFLFGFAFFGIIRHIIASVNLILYGGFYNQTSLNGMIDFILVILFIPFYSYLIMKKKIFKAEKKTVIFLSLSILLLILNSQIRFTLLIMPIILLTITKYMDKRQFIIQIAISLILILLIINPYLIQSGYQINDGDALSIWGHEFGSFTQQINKIKIEQEFISGLILLDLNEITNEYNNRTFVVGNRDDSYQTMADIYWEKDVKEFVSIQDYRLYLTNSSIISEKEFCSNSIIKSRRDICASMLIRKAFNDDTDYTAIRYAISEEDDLDLEGFRLIKKYRKLSLFEKI